MLENLLKKPIWILIAILCLGFGLRTYKIGAYGLAGDEKYSLFVSQFVSYEGNNQQNSVRNSASQYFTPAQFWSVKNISDFNDSIARIDTGNGAFYTFFLHYWTLIFGLEDAQLRFPSLIFNLITIVLLYFFTKKVFDSVKLALFVCFLSSVSPFFINYSQIARNYSLQFFFTLLSTYLFLIIVDNFKNNLTSKKIYFLYGFSVLFAELCHISVFSLYFAHGLYILIFFRDLRLIGKLLLAFLIPFVGLMLWLNSDGGKWLFHYVNNSVKTYNIMANSNPDEYLSPASITSILKQMRHVISCVFVSSEGLYLKLSGLKNFFLTLILSSISYLSFVLISNDKRKFSIISILIVCSILLVSVQNMHYFVLFCNIFLVLYTIHNFKNAVIKNQSILLLMLIAIVPLVMLILFAFKDGNTFRIITRYVGFCYATNLILFSYFIFELFKEKSRSKYLILSGFIVQFVFLMGINISIFEDNPPRYFTTFPEKRIENPYTVLAKTILNSYQKGDTVLYCSFNDDSMPIAFDSPKYSVVDAQLTNFYLPKTASIIQRVDVSELNKVFLKKRNGNKIELFDFEGFKYRF